MRFATGPVLALYARGPGEAFTSSKYATLSEQIWNHPFYPERPVPSLGFWGNVFAVNVNRWLWVREPPQAPETPEDWLKRNTRTEEVEVEVEAASAVSAAKGLLSEVGGLFGRKTPTGATNAEAEAPKKTRIETRVLPLTPAQETELNVVRARQLEFGKRLMADPEYATRSSTWPIFKPAFYLGLLIAIVILVSLIRKILRCCGCRCPASPGRRGNKNRAKRQRTAGSEQWNWQALTGAETPYVVNERGERSRPGRGHRGYRRGGRKDRRVGEFSEDERMTFGFSSDSDATVSATPVAMAVATTQRQVGGNDAAAAPDEPVEPLSGTASSMSITRHLEALDVTTSEDDDETPTSAAIASTAKPLQLPI